MWLQVLRSTEQHLQVYLYVCVCTLALACGWHACSACLTPVAACLCCLQVSKMILKVDDIIQPSQYE
jgi:hypothetical protein